MSRRRRTALALAGIAALLWAWNTPALVRRAESEPILLAHGGLGQDYSHEGLGGDTCTASRMLSPEHAWLDNTLPSFRAAFDFGADVVEFDVHPTTDGEFAVFHDWTIDCRTEGSGVTRERSMVELKTLDVGYGYTADGGRTFPFRGRGVGMMPSLSEVLETFPDRRFLVNVKSDDPEEGAALAAKLAGLPVARQRQLMAYGGSRPIEVLRDRVPAVRSMSRPLLKSCILRYAALGWTGHVPRVCRHTVLLLPANVAPWLWGWPNRFLARMESAGSTVFLVNDYRGGFSTGIDTLEDLAEKVPEGYTGGIWTDRIDRIGPATRPR